MQVKKELAGRIVADFHSATDAKQAEEDFAREVQQGGVPSDVRVEYGSAGDIRLPQFMLGTNMSGTRSEAERLLKAGAVEIDGVRHTDIIFRAVPGTHVMRVGKKWLRVIVKE